MDKKCPICNKKGLHYANHSHAFGYKDYNRLECRFCHNQFKIKDNNSNIADKKQ